MRIRGADFVVHYVSDLGRSVSFYRDILGLPLELCREDWNWAEFSVFPTTLVLFGDYPGAPLKPGRRGSVGLALAVDDLTDALNELQQKGIAVVDGPHDLSACAVAMIVDPDDNPIFLHQRNDGTCG